MHFNDSMVTLQFGVYAPLNKYLYEITILVPTANRSVRSVLYLQLVYHSER